MASRWEKNGNMIDFIFLGSKITADSNCSQETKRLLLLGRKTMVNIDSVLKSRDKTLLIKVCLSRAMASGPITSWQIDGETMEIVIDFIWGGSKITADGDCSHEIKRHLLLGRKLMTNLDSIFKSRDITLPTKFCLSQSYGFSSSHVWM